LNSSSRRRMVSVAFVMAAAVLLASSVKFPLWHLRMEAPQYREQEALCVHVFPGAMRGDLREITVLNQYIGVHIPATLPQTTWLPGALLASAAVGIAASLLPSQVRAKASLIAPLILAAVVGVAVVQALQQMHDIGHKRDAHTKLARVRDFNPPFLGTAKIAQFTVTSWFGAGAYLMGVAFALQMGAAVLGRRHPLSQKAKAAGFCSLSAPHSSSATL
jgi:hypothetical protein